MHFPFGSTVYRLRAGHTDTGYGGNPIRADWDQPDELKIEGAFVGPASTAVALAAGREQASEAVSLFCEGEWDIQQGDRIRNGPEGASLYSIEGIPPEAATHPFTGGVRLAKFCLFAIAVSPFGGLMRDTVRIVDNDDAYEQILRAARTEQIVENVADRILKAAVASAPERSGAYKRGIRKRHKQAKFRRVTQIVATDRKSLLIEAKTGNLARAARAAKK